ncbi:MAG: hypothetical protein ABIH36_04505 [bacterium]
MRIRVISAFALLSTIIVFTLFLLFTHLSAWFIWELLPPGDIKIAVNQTHPATSFLTDYLSGTQLGPILEKLEFTRRFAISKLSGTATIIVVPDNPLLFRNHKALTEQLNNAGFHTQPYGLLIIARQNDGTDDIVHTGFYRTLRQTTRRLFSNTLSAKPFLIASMESGTIPFLENSLTVLGTVRGDSIQLTATEPTIDFHSISYNISSPLQQESELTVAIPSHILSILPESLHYRWNHLLTNNLGLTRIQPDIISTLAQYNSPVTIKLSQNSAVIAVAKMQKTFSDTAKKWVQAEEAYARQRQKAFLLPDGSLGYELVPGDIREVFVNSASSNNCRQDSYPTAEKDMRYLWLCISDNITAFGSDENATTEASQKIFSTPGSWYVSLGAQYLTDLSLSGIKSVFATGTDTQAVIRLQLRDTL